MRYLTVVLVAALSGCISAEPAAVEPALEPDPAHPMSRSDFSWSPLEPRVGEAVQFIPEIRSGVPDNDLERIIWDFGPVQYVDNRPVYTFDTAGDHVVSARIETTRASDWTVTHTVTVLPGGSGGGSGGSGGNPGGSNPPPDAPEDDTEILPTPPGFRCAGQEIMEPFRTHGRDGDVMWAVLKTGFRFAIAFEGEATLTYDTGLAERTETGTSIIILDDLPEGRNMCFRLDDGPWHAVHLGNAMTSYDGVYTVNFLVLVNEYTRANILEEAMASFAERMVDATDGHIRVGNIIVVTDLSRQTEAVHPCWNGYVGHTSLLNPLCQRAYDIIFTHNVHPAAAGATYKDGIYHEDITIWMNAVHEAGLLSNIFTPESQIQEVAVVTLHEVGHYMIGAQDLYPEGGIVTSDCYQASAGISIMSSSRDATEFDGKDVPCPTANSEYLPTWQEMTKRFPLIPDRVGGTVPGPYHNGGAYGYGVYEV